MEKTLNQITRNALCAMVDLLLDYGKGEPLDSQTDNIREFILDCWNLSETDAEYTFLVEKFVEEFENQSPFVDGTSEQTYTFFRLTGNELMTDFELPPLIREAIDVCYKG